MENDAPVVGPDAPTANSKIIKLDIATADWANLQPVDTSIHPLELQVFVQNGSA
jgi:hypothetical protein